MIESEYKVLRYSKTLDVLKKYGFEFEINPFSKAVGSVGSNFPYVYGQCVEWIRFHYSFFRKDGLIEYKMYLE